MCGDCLLYHFTYRFIPSIPSQHSLPLVFIHFVLGPGGAAVPPGDGTGAAVVKARPPGGKQHGTEAPPAARKIRR